MDNESRGIGLVQLVWILAGLLVAVAAGFHIFQHPWFVCSIQYALPGGLADERLSVFRPSARLRYFSSFPNGRVLRRESN